MSAGRYLLPLMGWIFLMAGTLGACQALGTEVSESKNHRTAEVTYRPPSTEMIAGASATPSNTSRATTAAVAIATATTHRQPTSTFTPNVTGAGTTTAPAPSATAERAPTTCLESGSVISGTFISATAGASQAYRIYLPRCYQAQRHLYPGLYLFAGNIHDESKWDELGLDEAADDMMRSGDVPPFVIVMPDGGWLANNTSGGPGSYESLVLDELIPHVEQTYCVSTIPDHRAIGGLSRGGYWALEIAFRHPEQFASVGGHSAALLDQFAGPAVNPQFTAVNNELGQLRIYLDIGADDYLIANTLRLHQDMAAAGKDHTWVLNEGRHDDTYWAAHVEDYLQWYGAAWQSERESYPPCRK